MNATFRTHARLAYAALCYLLALAPMIYFVGFLANRLVPRTIDSGAIRPYAAAVDAALVLAFGVVHTLLARPRAKRRLAGAVGVELERPTYSAIAGAQMTLLIWAWRPLPDPLWSAESEVARAAIWALYGLGWGLALAGAAALGTARLYGLKPLWDRYRGRPAEPEALAVKGPYRWIRHPLYAGTILALWSAPTMSAGRALLAALFTIYILIGMRFEERDLLAAHGARFADYRHRVGALVPRRLRPRKAEVPVPID